MNEIPKVKEIINQLKDLDLSKYPKSEIQELMDKVGFKCDIKVHFKAGIPIIRGRLNKPSERFEVKADYSFKPDE